MWVFYYVSLAITILCCINLSDLISLSILPLASVDVDISLGNIHLTFTAFDTQQGSTTVTPSSFISTHHPSHLPTVQLILFIRSSHTTYSTFLLVVTPLHQHTSPLTQNTWLHQHSSATYRHHGHRPTPATVAAIPAAAL